MSLPASMQKIDQRIFLKGEHQAAVVYLGKLALSASTAASYAAQAAANITQVLEVEYSFFWKLDEDLQNLVLMAASGEIKPFSPSSSFPLHPNSLEKATLASVDPITFENSRNETALHFLDPIAARQVENGINVRIGTLEKPYGILQVFSTQGQFFSQQANIYFLQSVANLTGLVFHQGQCRLEAPTAGVPVKKTQLAIQSGVWEWDRHELKNRLVEGSGR